MHSQQITWNPQAGWTQIKAAPEKVSLVFYFGTRQMLTCGKRCGELPELIAAMGPNIPRPGGLSGDGDGFTETLVGGECVPRPRMVVGIGFYGSAIRIGHGSAGGWDLFGPRRQVTKSTGNVLFELDGQPALDLYERYLGPEYSKGLPGSALLFPIQVPDANRP